MSSDRFSKSNIFLAILACMLWASAFAGIKIGLKYWPPIIFAGVRFMISGLILVPIWLKTCKSPWQQIKLNFGIILYISFLQTFLLYALFYYGLTLAEGAIAAIVIGTSPLTIAMFAHILLEKDKLSWQKVISLVLGFSGVVIICIDCQPWETTSHTFWGIVILFVSTLSAGYGNIVIAKEEKLPDAILLNSVQIFIGGAGLFLLGLSLETFPSFEQPVEFYLALSWLSVLAAVACSIWIKLLKDPDIQPSELNMWKFIIPVFGAILSWLILPKETPDFIAIIGMSLVAISIIAFFIQKRRKSKQTCAAPRV